MHLYPAIDLRDGRCVRLTQGDFDRQTTYSTDPVEVAASFEAAGAGWIHVVDLDAARTGKARNRSVVADIAASVDVPIQTGGGIRSVDSARALFECGVARVVVGTAAVEHPDLVGDLVAMGHRVAVGLDVRGTEVVTHGWETGTGIELAVMLGRFADVGAEATIVTQISTDGTLAGPDLDGLCNVLEVSETPLIASGGVGSIADLEALVAVSSGGRSLAGVIVGKALHDGVISISDAVVAVQGKSS